RRRCAKSHRGRMPNRLGHRPYDVLEVFFDRSDVPHLGREIRLRRRSAALGFPSETTHEATGDLLRFAETQEIPMPRDLSAQIEKTIREFTMEVDQHLDAWTAARTPIAFRAMEQEVAAAGRSLTDAIVAAILQDMVADPELQALASVASRWGGRYRNGGAREVGVTLLGGSRARRRGE